MLNETAVEMRLSQPFYEGYLHATLEVATCLDEGNADGHYIWNKLCDNLSTMKSKLEDSREDSPNHAE